MAETVAPSSAAMADAQLAQDDLTRWMVFDQTGIDTYGWDVTEPQCDPEYSFKADTLEELAELIGVPADALVQTVETYNGYVEAGEDADFGKDPEKLAVKIENGPFYGVGVVMFIHDSEGGLAINGNCQVVNYKYEPIPGLYAGGDAAGGLSLLGIARSVPQGYIAGQHIVAQA